MEFDLCLFSYYCNAKPFKLSLDALYYRCKTSKDPLLVNIGVSLISWEPRKVYYPSYTDEAATEKPPLVY